MSQDQLVLTQNIRLLTPATSKYTASFYGPISIRTFVSIPKVGADRAALHLRYRIVLSLGRDSLSTYPLTLTPSPSRRPISRFSTSTDTASAAPALNSGSMTMGGLASLNSLSRTTGYKENTLRGCRYEAFSATQLFARERLRARIRSNKSFSCLKRLERQVDLPLPVAFFCRGKTPRRSATYVEDNHAGSKPM